MFMNNGDIAGPVLSNGVWSWTVPKDFDINSRIQKGIYELILMANNTDDSLAAQSESVFITSIAAL